MRDMLEIRANGGLVRVERRTSAAAGPFRIWRTYDEQHGRLARIADVYDGRYATDLAYRVAERDLLTSVEV